MKGGFVIWDAYLNAIWVARLSKDNMQIWLSIGSTYADWLARRTFDLICDERTYFRLISAIDGYSC